MVDISASFSQIFYTYKDVKEANPDWSDKMIEDYLARGRDIVSVTEIVSDQGVREAYPWPIDHSEYQMGAELNSLFGAIDHSEHQRGVELSGLFTTNELPDQFRAVTVSAETYTALPNDFINAKGRASIKFPAQPPENCVIIIRNGDASLISLDGNGKTINGSNSGYLRKQGTAIHFHYFIDSDEWFAR